MARSKSNAATCAALSKELVSKLGELHTARGDRPTTAAASVRHESLVLGVWSLQFQIANLKLLDANSDAERDRLQRLTIAASREIAEHEKRLVVARKAIADDEEIEAEAHEQQQDELAGKLLRLAKQ